MSIFSERKQVAIRLSFSSHFIYKLLSFTSEKVRFNVVKNKRKIHLFIPSKDKIQHLLCHCLRVFREKIRNCRIRWDERSDVTKNSEPANHLTRKTEHEFSWCVFTRNPENTLRRRIMEAYFTKLIVPSLNEQLDNDLLMSLRFGLT